MSTNSSDHTVAETFREEGFLRAVVDTIVDAIITVDTRGIIQHANPAIHRVFGYTPQELVGRNVSLLMPSPDRENHDQYVARYLETRTPKIIGIGRQVTGLRKDGALFPVELAVSEVTFGGKTYFTGVVRDISEQVQAQEVIRRERDFSRSLIDTAHAIILVLDPRGRIERFNPYLEELTGYALDEVAGRDWFEIFIPEREQERIRETFQLTLSGVPVVSNINSIRTRRGDERIVTWSGRRLMNLDGDVVGVLAVGNDITELKAAETRLVQSERLAAVGQMVTGLAHESRNALQRTQASLEMLELDLGDRPDQVELIQRAKRAMRELQRLYEEVRSYAAPIKLDRREFQLTQLLTETWDQVQQATPTTSLTLPMSLTLRLDCDRRANTLNGDYERLQQVFRNIYENALAVSQSNGVINVNSRAVALNGLPAVRIAIRDEGPGLSPEQQARIFDPFYTTKVRGTGLGMAIAHRIVNAHGGTLQAGNHRDAGAEIVVTLPCR